jgi:hypothetical protein
MSRIVIFKSVYRHKPIDLKRQNVYYDRLIYQEPLCAIQFWNEPSYKVGRKLSDNSYEAFKISSLTENMNVV